MGRAKYCSRDCVIEAKSGKGHWHWDGGKSTFKCLQCGKKFEEYTFMEKRKKLCSRDCLYKWQETSLKGKNNPNWRNGISTEANIVRTSAEYERWKKTVFKRDDFTCQLCGIRGGDLNAHHILSFRDFPEYRLTVDNGITYCVECHDIVSSILAMGDTFQPLPRLNA